MKTRIFLATAALGASLALASTSSAEDATGGSPLACALSAHRVTHVKPLYVKGRVGRVTLTKLRGATLYVRAERGLSAEWLGLNIQRHIAAMPASGRMPGCPLDFDKLSVTVKPTKIGYAVELTVKNRAQAEELLKRARALTP